MGSYTVYWQPGCTSCLKVKEFLRAHGIAFESVNVRADAGAFARLAQFGVKTVPVIARDDHYVLGQDLDAVARFVGIAEDRVRLEVPALIARLVALLDVAARCAQLLPETSLAKRLPGRERTHLDLAYHVSQIVVAFLDAAQGGRLTYEHFERTPPAHIRTGADAGQLMHSVARALAVWWAGSRSRLPVEVDTYYGEQPLRGALERTTWHVAQHVRQLALVLERAGVADRPVMPPSLLEHLPLPADAWDAEVPMP